MMSASTSRNKRKNQPVEKPSGPRPSVFDRLGTKASSSQQPVDSQNRSNFCHHWRNTGNCPFGASCKNASYHVLISPSKRAKGIEKESKELSRSQKELVARGKKGKGDNWAELDEGELERRRLLLQKELDLQSRQEMKKKSNKKKRSSSSSSSSTAQTLSESSKASSSKSAQQAKRKPRARRRKGRGGGVNKQAVPKEPETKRMREMPKDSKKRSSSSGHQERRSRSKHRTGSSSGAKKRKNSSSSDTSSLERKRQQSKSSSHQSKMKGRSPTPDKKKKQPPAAYDKKLSPSRRREAPDSRRNSPPRSRKRSLSPARPRRRTPSPRAKIAKKHESRNNSPSVSRHRSPSIDRKESRRGQTPPSPHERHPQRSGGGGRSSRRSSPEPHRAPPSRESRGRPQAGRSPDRRPRASSRELRDNLDKRDYQRQEYSSPAPARGHTRGSPDNGGRPSSRDRRDEPSSSRDKSRLKESDRDRRREAPSDKSRDRARGRDEELPSLMNIMTQHPQHSPRRGGRDESQDHRSSGRERGRYDRYDDRGEGSNHPEDRGAKRSSRRDSPARQRSQKSGRDWSDHPEQRDKDWERRGKSGTSGHRDWEEPAKQSRGSKGHRRAQSPLDSASPIKDNEKDLDSKSEEMAEQRRSEGHQIGDDDSTESPSKKSCHEGDAQAAPGTFPESDFSDFSDDDDDILNADVAEENNEASMEVDDKLDGADGEKLDKDDDEPVEDILEDMDFEEISDGELDAEEIKAGADALSVDWAALLTQTRHVKKDECEAIINRWDITTALSRIGVPQSLKGGPDLKDLGLEPPDMENRTKIEDNKVRMSFLFDPDTKLQDKVPGVHAAIVMKKEQIASILNPMHQRGIDFAYGEQLKKICPFKNQNDGGINKDRGVTSNVKQLVQDMLKGSCRLEEVQKRLLEEPRKVEV